MANRDITIESALPVVSSNGLNSNVAVDFSASPSAALPASTTVGGSPISALGNITGSNTTGATFSVTNSGVYTGVGAVQVIGDSATTGVVALMTGNGLTTGTVLSLTSTGTIITTGEVLNIAANSATTSTGLVRISGTGITTGSLIQGTATAATMTTGRYLSFSDSTAEVFGIGTNGHIISVGTAAAATAAVTAAHGITAVTVTAGATDTCGIITTTGTQDNSTDTTFTLTFGKTYTTAPKAIVLFAANASGANGTSLPYLSSISATAAVIGVTKSATAGATPSWSYIVIA